MDDNDKILYMVVDIDKSKRYPNYVWVSFADLQGNYFSKRWVDLSKNEHLKYGKIGEFDENREFRGTQDYFDLKQRYSVGRVESVEQATFFKCPVYKYHVLLADGDFDTTFIESSDQFATVGNWLLLHYEKYIMNITTMENVWNLFNHYNVKKYGLRPSYRGSVANKYCPTAADKEYKNYQGKVVTPAVVSRHYGDNQFCVFAPQKRWCDIQIVISGKFLPLPRPSDVVLLDKTEEKDKFVLVDNLTMAVEARDMQNKFGLPSHQANMRDCYQNCFEKHR